MGTVWLRRSSGIWIEALGEPFLDGARVDGADPLELRPELFRGFLLQGELRALPAVFVVFVGLARSVVVRCHPMSIHSAGPASGVGAGTCFAAGSYALTAGDVSLDYALEAIMRRKPEAAPRAEPLLKRLRGS